MVTQGATTIWELWNGDTADPAMNSGNHLMLVGDLITGSMRIWRAFVPIPRSPLSSTSSCAPPRLGN